MTASPPKTVCYELQGKSLEAARWLSRELHREILAVRPKQEGNLAEIQVNWKAMYDGLFKRLKRENPEMLAATGLLSPAVCVYQAGPSCPRSYVEYPAIIASPQKAPRFFIYAPVDYKGNHFVPPDAKRLDAKEQAAADSLLFAGGWLGNGPLLDMGKTGTALPADYSHVPSAAASFNDKNRSYRCYIARGESLKIVEDFNRRKSDYDARVTEAFDRVRDLAQALFPQVRAALDSPDEELNVSMMYGEHNKDGDRSGVELTIRKKWGEAVAMPENPHFTTDSKGHMYFRTDTPEGRALKEWFDAMPARPGLSDYPRLHAAFSFERDDIDKMIGVNGIVPQALQFGHYTVLRYNTAAGDETPFCPPDALPLSTAAYMWLDADKSDANMGITPPPMPREIAQMLGESLSRAPVAKTARRAPE